MLSPPLVSEALPRSLANVQDGLDHPNSQRGLSLQDLKSKGTELCPGSRESPHLGRDRPQWQAVPPCQVLRPGKVWKPTLSWSQDASLGLRQFLGQGWVPHQHQHGHRHRLAGRGICHQPPQVSVLWGGSAGRPALAGGAPPHCSGSGVAAGGLETRQTLTNSAWFPLTSLQPYLVAQPKPEAPQHLSLPAQKGRAGLSWPLKPRLGFLLQAGNRPVQGVQCLSCNCPLAGPRQCLDTGAHYRSPQRSRKDRTCRFCAVVVI